MGITQKHWCFIFCTAGFSQTILGWKTSIILKLLKTSNHKNNELLSCSFVLQNIKRCFKSRGPPKLFFSLSKSMNVFRANLINECRKKRQDDECGAHRKSIRWSDHEHALHRWEHSRCCVWRVFVREVSREGLKVCKVNCWEKVLGWDRGHIYIAWLLVVVGSFWKMGCYLDSWIKLNIFLVSFPLNQDPGVFSHLALWLAVENGLRANSSLKSWNFRVIPTNSSAVKIGLLSQMERIASQPSILRCPISFEKCKWKYVKDAPAKMMDGFSCIFSWQESCSFVSSKFAKQKGFVS